MAERYQIPSNHTPSAMGILVFAKVQATSLGFKIVRPVDVLCAIAYFQDSNAAIGLRALGIETPDMVERGSVRRPTVPVNDPSEMLLWADDLAHCGLWQVILEEAGAHAGGMISDKILLLALARHNDADVEILFNRGGRSSSEVYSFVLGMTGELN